LFRQGSCNIDQAHTPASDRV